ncbi:MAG: helix-turn-helix transcriptional regulator [Myxococcota bacterium]
MNKELAKCIGEAARAARKALQLTQEDVAERIGVSVEFYARIERGTSLPSIITFTRLVAVLNISADVLLGRRPLGATPYALDPWAPERTEEPPQLRRVVRRLRGATPGTLRVVSLLLKELERINSHKE